MYGSCKEEKLMRDPWSTLKIANISTTPIKEKLENLIRNITYLILSLEEERKKMLLWCLYRQRIERREWERERGGEREALV